MKYQISSNLPLFLGLDWAPAQSSLCCLGLLNLYYTGLQLFSLSGPHPHLISSYKDLTSFLLLPFTRLHQLWLMHRPAAALFRIIVVFTLARTTDTRQTKCLITSLSYPASCLARLLLIRFTLAKIVPGHAPMLHSYFWPMRSLEKIDTRRTTDGRQTEKWLIERGCPR